MAILIQDADLSAKRISASGLTPDEDFRAQVGNIVSTAYACPLHRGQVPLSSTYMSLRVLRGPYESPKVTHKLVAGGIYAIEMISRVYVFRIAVFRSAMLFDFIIALA